MPKSKTDWNAPIPGQAAAIVVSKKGAYRARFPAEVAGGMDKAKAAAEAWRKDNAPGATVREFTGESVLIWNDAQGFADLFRAMLAAGFDRGAARNIMAEAAQAEFPGHIAQARESYASDDVEIDDAPEVSEADNGVWVAAWVWVRDDEVTDYDSDDVCPGCGCPMGEDHADDCEEAEEQEA